jgi:hypothetical protein
LLLGGLYFPAVARCCSRGAGGVEGLGTFGSGRAAGALVVSVARALDGLGDVDA